MHPYHGVEDKGGDLSSHRPLDGLGVHGGETRGRHPVLEVLGQPAEGHGQVLEGAVDAVEAACLEQVAPVEDVPVKVDVSVIIWMMSTV